MKIKLRNFEHKLLYLLLMYMPLHYYICEVFLKRMNIDNIFRDIVIIFLFVLSLRKNIKIKNSAIIGFGIIIMVIFSIISIVFLSLPGTFNILRTYIVPMLIFFVVSKMNIFENEFIKINRIVYIGVAIIGVYGFVQAFLLGDDFLINIGYPQNGGFLASSSYYIGGFFGYQRNVGTFVSPNVCGAVIAIALAVLIFNNYYAREKEKSYCIVALVLGGLSTFSRSSMVAFIGACFVIFTLKGSMRKIRKKTVLTVLFGMVIVILLFYFIDTFFLNQLFSRMLKSSFTGMFNLTDTSAQKHLEDLYMPLQNILQHPFGLGFGNNGPMALTYNSDANAVESSFYLISYEIGILGAVLYFIPYFLVIIHTVINRQYKYYAPACISIICLITYFFLPNVQTYEIVFYAFLYMGLYYNRSVRTLFMCKL